MGWWDRGKSTCLYLHDITVTSLPSCIWVSHVHTLVHLPWQQRDVSPAESNLPNLNLMTCHHLALGLASHYIRPSSTKPANAFISVLRLYTWIYKIKLIYICRCVQVHAVHCKCMWYGGEGPTKDHSHAHQTSRHIFIMGLDIMHCDIPFLPAIAGVKS